MHGISSHCHSGAGALDACRLFANWDRPRAFADPGIAFKLHPCCESTHAALDALLHLRGAHDLTPKYVRRIECWMHPRRLSPTNQTDPSCGAEAKFSLHYVLARALKQGLVRLADFSRRGVARPCHPRGDEENSRCARSAGGPDELTPMRVCG